jgi:hypothetical protein
MGSWSGRGEEDGDTGIEVGGPWGCLVVYVSISQIPSLAFHVIVRVSMQDAQSANINVQ